MTSRRQYSVPGRILLIFILTAVVMAAIFLGVVRVGNDAERLAREIVGQNVVAVKALKEMEVALVGQDEAVSRYLLTRDPRWLEKRGEDWSRFARGLSQVRDVVGTEAELQRLREIDDALPRYHAQVERVLEAATQGWDSDVVNRLRRENSLLPELQANCQALLAIHERLLESNRTEAEATALRYRTLGYVSLGAMVVAALVVGLLLRSSVLVPLRQLTEGARAYQKGDLDHRVPRLGNGDLGGLGQTFNEMAAALEQERGRLTEMSITDELTQLKNFRHFAARLEEEVRRAERYGHQLSLVLFDIDYFKQYNDAHGHPAGNEVLRVIGQLLRDNARTTDILARYGGEELAAILPETTKPDAARLAEKIRQLIHDQPFPGEEYQPEGWLTVSAGVASLPADATSPTELLDAADKALYAAKGSGRDRVVLYSAELSQPARKMAGSRAG